MVKNYQQWVDGRDWLQQSTTVADGLKPSIILHRISLQTLQQFAGTYGHLWTMCCRSFVGRPYGMPQDLRSLSHWFHCSTLWHTALVTTSEGWMSLFNTTSDSNLASLSLENHVMVKPASMVSWWNHLSRTSGWCWRLLATSRDTTKASPQWWFMIIFFHLRLSPNSCFTTA